MTEPRSLAIPKNSPIVLDTNVLIDSVEDGASFQPFFAALSEREAFPALSVIVDIEFRRGFSSPEKPTGFLERWFGKDYLLLQLDASVYQHVYNIDRINQRQGNKKVKIGDLLIAAQIARYSLPKRNKNNLLLATQNHKDFSPALFDLLDVMNLRTASGVIKTVGIYAFNADRFQELCAQL